MNAEEVVKMLDAITEGKEYVQEWESATRSGSIAIDNRGNNLRLVIEEDGCEIFDISDPRTAREIACALVAWANSKDGIIFDQLTAAANLSAMRKRQNSEDAQHSLEGAIGLYEGGIKE